MQWKTSRTGLRLCVSENNKTIFLIIFAIFIYAPWKIRRHDMFFDDPFTIAIEFACYWSALCSCSMTKTDCPNQFVFKKTNHVSKSCTGRYAKRMSGCHLVIRHWLAKHMLMMFLLIYIIINGWWVKVTYNTNDQTRSASPFVLWYSRSRVFVSLWRHQMNAWGKALVLIDLIQQSTYYWLRLSLSPSHILFHI